MMILQRGVPAHVHEKDLRKPYAVSMSDAERERYAIAAQARGTSLSAFIRSLLDREIQQVDGAIGPEGDK